MTVAKWVADGFAQRVKRAPIPIGGDGPGGMQLGTVLEIESLRDFQFRWRKHKPKLLWDMEHKALIFVDVPNRVLGPKDKLASQPIPPHGKGKGATVFRGFHGREAKRITAYRVKTRGDQWITFGSVVRIDYFSTRQSKREQYTHKHGSGVRLYRLGEDTGPTLWVLKGGRLNVTARGIVH